MRLQGVIHLMLKYMEVGHWSRAVIDTMVDLYLLTVEGIPPADLKAWKKRKEVEAGITSETTVVKRVQVDLGVISQEELRRKLSAHKDLMEGRVAPAPTFGAPPPFMPPPMMG